MYDVIRKMVLLERFELSASPLPRERPRVNPNVLRLRRASAVEGMIVVVPALRCSFQRKIDGCFHR